MDVAADVHGDGHDGQAGGDEDEGLFGVETGGGVADDAAGAIDEEDGGDGGAEGALVEAADLQVDDVEWPAGAEQGADEAAEAPGGDGPVARGVAVGIAAEQRVEGIEQHKAAEEAGEQCGVDGLEQVERGADADEGKGQQRQDLTPGDGAAVFQAVGERGAVVEQADHRHHDGERQHHRQQRDGDQPGAEAGDAAHHVGNDKDRAGEQQLDEGEAFEHGAQLYTHSAG